MAKRLPSSSSSSTAGILTRFLDVDRIDLILRRRRGSTVEYREVQVKFGKLYECTAKWELPLFSVSAWRLSDSALTGLTEREGLFLSYVLAPDDGFKGDMSVFPMKEFAELVRTADRLRNGDYRDVPPPPPRRAG